MEAPPAQTKRYRTVSFTSLEKRALGHKTGRYTRTFTEAHYPPGELDEHVRKLREEQDRKNALFRGTRRIEKDLQDNGLVAPPSGPAEAPTAAVPATAARDFPAPPAAANNISLKLDDNTGNSTALIGSSKQGKSTCMMELYRQYYSGEDFVSTLFADNPQIALYRDPRLVVCPAYEPRMIKLAHTINRKTKNHYDFLFLLDDIVDKRDDTILKQLILTHRNSNISSIVCLQFTNLLAKVARANVNNLLLFGLNSDEAIDLVCHQFLASHLRTCKIPERHWCQYYREATKNHGFLYTHPSSGEVSYHRLAL